MYKLTYMFTFTNNILHHTFRNIELKVERFVFTKLFDSFFEI